MVLTSDSHRGRKEDIEAYIKMHELKNSNEEYLEHIRETYYERYMPDKNEMQKRFVKMHKDDIGFEEAKILAKEMEINLEEIARISHTSGHITNSCFNPSVDFMIVFTTNLVLFKNLATVFRRFSGSIRPRGIYKSLG